MLRGANTSAINFTIKKLPRATVFIDTDFRVAHVSDKWVSDFGFTRGEVVGKTIYELFDTVSPGWQQILEACLLGKGNEEGVESYFDENNNERWFEWFHIPWYDDQSNIIGVIIQTEDITEQMLTKAKLEKVEMLLNEKSAMSKIGSWEYDASKDMLYWCAMTRQIHEVAPGYTPTLGNGYDFYVEGYSRNTISMAFFKAIELGTPWSEKVQLTTAKGNDIWVISTGKPLYKNGKYSGLIGTFQDITDHVKSEIKTKKSENLLRTVVDNLPLSVYIKDLESRKLLVNQAECEFLEVDDPEELLGKTDFDFYDKKIAQRFRDEDLYVLSSMKPILAQESIITKKNGKNTTFLSSKIPLKSEDGIAYGLLGISLDISDLKQKEQELRDLINVTSLQNKKLVNFAHIVSHNLRSHTANFSMLLDFLVMEKDENEKKNIIKMLVEASDNLLETLENLNEVVEINSNVNLEKKPVNLNEKITAVQQNLSAFLKNNNAKIINTIPADATVKVIPAYMDSILMNFITNAVKYKDPQRNPIIKLSAKKSGNYHILSIEDNGLGIDLKKYGDKLFGMYKTFHKNQDARGIGLYITKNQVEAMKGKIITCSEVGKGTIFNVYFNEES